MLCIINEALYAFQGITPVQTDNIMQMFPSFCEMGTSGPCERQVCMDLLIFKLKCSGAERRLCSKSRQGVM